MSAIDGLPYGRWECEARTPPGDLVVWEQPTAVVRLTCSRTRVGERLADSPTSHRVEAFDAISSVRLRESEIVHALGNERHPWHGTAWFCRR